MMPRVYQIGYVSLVVILVKTDLTVTFSIL